MTALLVTLLPAVSPRAADADDASQAQPLEEVLVTALEPRYVARTRRDQIGRIWAPVYINDRGPFRLVLDTGATHSGVIASVAEQLGLPINTSSNVILRGVTGNAVVPTVRVNSLHVGDLRLSGRRLPIITDALGGAEGILGTEGLTDKRVHIDFRLDLIRITRSNAEPAPAGFITIPLKFSANKLPMAEARMGSLKIKAIIDTGGQATIANAAARDALAKRYRKIKPSIDTIVGTTAEKQEGEGYPSPGIEMGDILIRNSHITYGDMEIFKHWRLTDEPAVLIGMDVLGLLDTLIIDYKRSEMQIKLHRGS